MRVRSHSVALCVVMALFVSILSAGGVHGFSGGIIGYSGKQSDTCKDCHDDGVQPMVDFEGPHSFAADTMAQFRFVVQSQNASQRAAGLNVAASDGVLSVTSGESVAVEDGELTHTAPQFNDSEGIASWSFAWCVSIGGDYILFGCGNSVNLNGNRSGDASKPTQVMVHVTPPSGDTNCDGRRSAADLTAVFTSVNAGVCEMPQPGSAEGAANDTDAVIALLFAPTCQV